MEIIYDIGRVLAAIALFGVLMFAIPTLFMFIFNIATDLDRNLDR